MRRWSPFWILPLALAAAAGADVHPNTAPGFPVEQAFQVGEFDNVNLFNGGLTLTIPIGPSYPVSGGFSYALRLVYNSNPWDFLTQTYVAPDEPATRTQAHPTRCSNAGLGWRVSLGQLDPPCQVPDANGQLHTAVYKDENGTDHLFYEWLHPEDPEDAPVAGVQQVLYTRDGTYMRLKLFNDGRRELEFPDGSVRKFDLSGRLTEIRDPFANRLSVSYGTANQWVISDSQGRTHRVFFRADLPGYPQTIDRIEMAAFGGATAVYQFSYDTRTIGRACPHDDNGPNGLGDRVMVPLLTGVSLPEGSAWTTRADDYVIALPVNGCTEHAGAIEALTLPTLGRMEWTWRRYWFPEQSAQKKSLHSNPGVATRTMRNADGSVAGAWSYGRIPDTQAVVTGDEVATTVTDPLGHRTINYFSVATRINETLIGWSRGDYGLPFTRREIKNVAPGVDLNLSREIYAAGATSRLRSEWVLYEREKPTRAAGPAQTDDKADRNRRLVRSRTVYHDDGDAWAGVIYSDFDGLGHFRRQETEGSFPGSNVRVSYAHHNPDRGTYTINPATGSGSGWSVVPPGSPWVLEAPSYLWESEGGATAWTELCYAPGSAKVTRQRVRRQEVQGAKDLLTTYGLDGQGNVTSESFYGGDAQGGLPSGDLCALALPASPEYQLQHTYAYGARASSRHPGAGYFLLDQTIDFNTGLPASSRDGAGIQTDHEYDTLGRLTWAKPQAGHGGWTQLLYEAANPVGLQRASVTVRRRGNGSKTAPILAVDQVVFEDFGRVFQESRRLPDNATFSKRETLYDGAGNKASVSEPAVGAAIHKTFFFGYDPFGRPGTIRPPDGAAHDVILTYKGARQVERKVSIATAQGAETQATTTEVYDRHGRLLSVTEPSGSAGANVTTTYGYDVGNRLVSVSTPASVTQTRSFLYDRAGLLLSEAHPEKGAAGNGAVTYPKYDSRGHVLRKVDGPNDLSFLYDAAERLVRVEETATGRFLKEFSYAIANGANDRRQGKLRQATRYNYATLGATPYTIQVTETYTYGGVDGRASRRDTALTINGSPAESFTQGFAFNALGLASSLEYPRCTHGACTTPAAPEFLDVPSSHPDRLHIEAIHPAITSGCGGGNYCPNDAISRGQMAVFLLLAEEGPGYAPPACGAPLFADVPCSNPFAPWIHELYRRGITGGCGAQPLTYCPNALVAQAEMAVFLLSTRGISPPPCTGAAPFADVPCNHWAAAWIAEEARRQITFGCGGGNFCPTSFVTRAQMAGLLTRGFDIPLATDPNTFRTVQLAYNSGVLTSVSGGGAAYGTLAYHPNLLVSQVAHGNGVTETQGLDPNGMRRPAALGATGPYAAWSSGAYAYDGAGNVKAIGTSWFTYDKVSRLVSATLFDAPTGGGVQRQQSYAFDAFGNLTGVSGANGRATPTSAATNRLNGAGTSYDAAGNLTSWNSAVYQYDLFNQMSRMTSGAEDWIYVYTADDERLWSYRVPSNSSIWTLRDLGGAVLREYRSDNGRWSVGADYLYRDGLLLAAETQLGRRHFHLDHLGTPRLITRASGHPAAYHLYYPFGEEATPSDQDHERMKFTGHERDLASPAGTGDDLDYMHARHCSPMTGRFLSVDPALESVSPSVPQTWNRYSYVSGNPMSYTDPTGEILVIAGAKKDLKRLQKIANDQLHGVDLVIDKNGKASLVPNQESGSVNPEQQAFAGVLSGVINRSETVSLAVVSGDSGVLFGQYISGRVDIADIEGVGNGRGVTSAALLAHEIREQEYKQVNKLANTLADFLLAHAEAVIAQERVSGYLKQSGVSILDRRNTGIVTGVHMRGNARVTVQFHFVNGNLTKVLRRP